MPGAGGRGRGRGRGAEPSGRGGGSRSAEMGPGLHPAPALEGGRASDSPPGTAFTAANPFGCLQKVICFIGGSNWLQVLLISTPHCRVEPSNKT